jgi:nicotinamide riboside transporter PnuC
VAPCRPHASQSTERATPCALSPAVLTLEIRHAVALLLSIGLVGIGAWALEALLEPVSGATPLLDAFATTLGLAAQHLLNSKFIDNWYLWIVAGMLSLDSSSVAPC